MNDIRIISPTEELPEAMLASIFDLTNRTWPPTSADDVRDFEKFRETRKVRKGYYCLITDGKNSSEVLAHAYIFRRDIFTKSGTLGVGALAGVCVDLSHRGRGWGADVVRAAFGLMPSMGVTVSLFQTGVPQFYEKLGARPVENRIYNGQDSDNPNSPFADLPMIYPCAFDWPHGDIDLNGKGY